MNITQTLSSVDQQQIPNLNFNTMPTFNTSSQVPRIPALPTTGGLSLLSQNISTNNNTSTNTNTSTTNNSSNKPPTATIPKLPFPLRAPDKNIMDDEHALFAYATIFDEHDEIQIYANYFNYCGGDEIKYLWMGEVITEVAQKEFRALEIFEFKWYAHRKNLNVVINPMPRMTKKRFQFLCMIRTYAEAVCMLYITFLLK